MDIMGVNGILNKKELDQIFNCLIKPLRSENARLIFKILYDSEEEFLTTLDIQNALNYYENPLNKKELNNWLSDLQKSGLVQKKDERGKPTTISYEDRYTFDLWYLTKKGHIIMENLSVFTTNYPNLNEWKIIQKPKKLSLDTIKMLDLDENEVLYKRARLLIELTGLGDKANSFTLSEKTSIKHEDLVNFMKEYQKFNNTKLYDLIEKDLGFFEKILESFGKKKIREHIISLSSEGKKIASNILKP